MSTDSSYDPAILREQYTQQKLKRHAQSKRVTRDFDIQAGDTVLVKQPKREKLSTPYHPFLLTVTNKNHGMLTAEGSTRKMTRNSFISRSFSLTNRSELLMLRWKKTRMRWTCRLCQLINYSFSFCTCLVSGASDTESVNTTGCAETSTEVVPPRSARAPQPPKRLIQEI